MFSIDHLINEIRRRWRVLKDSGDAGYTTETVIAIALLAALAIAVLAIIGAKVLAKADSINLGSGGL